MSNWVAVMPVLQQGNAAECIDTMAEEVRQRVLVIDNSGRNLVLPPTGKKIEAGLNLGVARSWNLGIEWLEETGADLLFLLSSSVRFRTEGLDLWRVSEQADDWGVNTQLGWHCVGLTRKTFDAVGTFDEHFYPGYFEDTDFLYRMGLAGLPSPRENDRSMPHAHIQAVCADAMSVKTGAVKVDFAYLQEYYVRKWGGIQGFERFKTPFDLDLKWESSWKWWP